jgi:hypothetical protein
VQKGGSSSQWADICRGGINEGRQIYCCVAPITIKEKNK